MDKYYNDGLRVDGYYGIKDREDDDEYIWVDCTPEQLKIFIDALNKEEE
jgi:hypothetical protein